MIEKNMKTENDSLIIDHTTDLMIEQKCWVETHTQKTTGNHSAEADE